MTIVLPSMGQVSFRFLGGARLLMGAARASVLRDKALLDRRTHRIEGTADTIVLDDVGGKAHCGKSWEMSLPQVEAYIPCRWQTAAPQPSARLRFVRRLDGPRMSGEPAVDDRGSLVQAGNDWRRPRFDDLRSLAILRGDQPIFERKASENAPELRIRLFDQDSCRSQMTLLFRWGAADPDGEPLAVLIEVSAGPDMPWRPVAMLDAGTEEAERGEIEMEKDFLGSEPQQIRIRVSEGSDPKLALFLSGSASTTSRGIDPSANHGGGGSGTGTARYC